MIGGVEVGVGAAGVSVGVGVGSGTNVGVAVGSGTSVGVGVTVGVGVGSSKANRTRLPPDRSVFGSLDFNIEEDCASSPVDCRACACGTGGDGCSTARGCC